MRVDNKRWTRRQRSGGPEQQKGTQDDQEPDGKMTSRNWQVPSGWSDDRQKREATNWTGLCPEMDGVKLKMMNSKINTLRIILG